MKLEIISYTPTSPGKPSPILFVHGAFSTARVWDKFGPYFAQHGYHAHALNLRGHGGSVGHEELQNYGLDDYVADVAQTAAAFTTPPILVGHSMGGIVIQKYLVDHPLPAIVLISTSAPRSAWRNTLYLNFKAPLTALRFTVTRNPKVMVESLEQTRKFFYRHDTPDEVMAEYLANVQNESYKAFMDMLTPGFPKRMPSHTPALVVGGGKDAFMQPGEFSATAKAYQTTPVIFPELAHAMIFEPGWEQVADKILDWLTEQSL